MQAETNKKDYTSMLWQVSAARQPGNDINMSTGEALQILGDIIANTGPLNPLHQKAYFLREEIILQPQSQQDPGTAFPTTATVLAFPQSKKKD